jgi:GAF domain-containing protein
MVCDRDDHLAKEIQQKIFNHYSDRTFRETSDQFLSDVADGRLTRMQSSQFIRSDAFPHSLAKLLATGIATNQFIFAKSITRVRENEPSDLVYTGPTLRIGLLIFGANESLLNRSQTRLRTFRMMLYASPPVALHRGTLQREKQDAQFFSIQRKFDILNSPRNMGASNRGLLSSVDDAVYGEYLTVAIAQTGSDGGFVYTRDPRVSTTLLLRAFEPFQASSLVAPRNLDVVTNRKSIPSYVINKKRPVFINDVTNQRQYYEFLADKDLSKFVDLAQHLAVVPLTNHGYFTDALPCYGVLVLIKTLSASKPPFTVRAQRYLYELSSRISLLRSNLSSNSAVRTLERLIAGQLSDRDDHSISEYSCLQESEADNPAPSIHVPDELLGEQTQIKQWLEQAHIATNSYYSYMWLLATDARTLLPIVALPKDMKSDELSSINLTTQCIQSHVATDGNPKYESDINRNKSESIPEKPATRSEYCVPLFIASRLVGMLSFGSLYPNAYDDHLWFLGAVAGLISLHFDRTRREIEQRVLHFASKSTRRHDLQHVYDTLCAAVGNKSKTHHRQLLNKAVVDLRTLLDRDGKAPAPLKGPLTINRIIGDAINRIRDPNYSFATTVEMDWDSIRPEDIVVNAVELVLASWEVSPAVFSASIIGLCELLANAINHADTENTRSASISCVEYTLGGLVYVRARVITRVAVGREISDVDARNLFRRPIERSNRECLGCFIAGAVMRAVGGEAVLIDNRNGDVVTAIDIPVLSEGLHGEV